MAADDEQRPRIPRDGILRLFEELDIKSGERDAIKAAGVQLANYVSNPSVALLLRPQGCLYVGSGVCLRIANRYLVAMAKHNLEHAGQDLQISDLEVRARGEKHGPPLQVRRMGLAPDLDLAWLELSPARNAVDQSLPPRGRCGLGCRRARRKRGNVRLLRLFCTTKKQDQHENDQYSACESTALGS